MLDTDIPSGFKTFGEKGLVIPDTSRRANPTYQVIPCEELWRRQVNMLLTRGFDRESIMGLDEYVGSLPYFPKPTRSGIFDIPMIIDPRFTFSGLLRITSAQEVDTDTFDIVDTPQVPYASWFRIHTVCPESVEEMLGNVPIGETPATAAELLTAGFYFPGLFDIGDRLHRSLALGSRTLELNVVAFDGNFFLMIPTWNIQRFFPVGQGGSSAIGLLTRSQVINTKVKN